MSHVKIHDLGHRGMLFLNRIDRSQCFYVSLPKEMIFTKSLLLMNIMMQSGLTHPTSKSV